eukprot:comp20374_c0_seq1/m.25745 comp20374_c0_seq1/g.25745  ORF comp20374_c0_seq1/g.25745 comp20374_c0_seq1/m.25745 type:complete len:308 (-) comp20374_c0_seq1:188-1111(-)
MDVVDVARKLSKRLSKKCAGFRVWSVGMREQLARHSVDVATQGFSVHSEKNTPTTPSYVHGRWDCATSPIHRHRDSMYDSTSCCYSSLPPLPSDWHNMHVCSPACARECVYMRPHTNPPSSNGTMNRRAISEYLDRESPLTECASACVTSSHLASTHPNQINECLPNDKNDNTNTQDTKAQRKSMSSEGSGRISRSKTVSVSNPSFRQFVDGGAKNRDVFENEEELKMRNEENGSKNTEYKVMGRANTQAVVEWYWGIVSQLEYADELLALSCAVNYDDENEGMSVLTATCIMAGTDCIRGQLATAV